MDDARAAYAVHPVRLHITDDLQRTRLTALFRLLLAIPHFVWLALRGIACLFAAIGRWFVPLSQRHPPPGLHMFLAGYLRYATHVSAYSFLIADPYPGFYLLNTRPEYPIDLEVGPPVEQDRWTVGFRILLA